MKRKLQCQDGACAATLPRLAIGFCPFCGTAQVARDDEPGGVDEDLLVAAIGDAPAAPSRGHTAVTAVADSGEVRKPSDAGDATARFIAHMRAELQDTYCDATTFAGLVSYGIRACELQESRAIHVLAMQLEAAHIASERHLLEELDGLLRNFTEQDKCLDEKERQDAVDNACRPRPGYSRGLDRVEAERYVINFCRMNGVKVKTGWLRWAIP